MGYKHGLICQRGHARTPDNLTRRGQCKKCMAIKNKEWKIAHPNANTEANHRRQNRESGWTDERFETAMREQGGMCANEVCGTKLTFGKLMNSRCCKDHEPDRTPPKPRGLLCSRCNLILGFIEDQTDHLSGLLAYLRKYGK